MNRAARIAVVGPVDDRLVGELRALPLAPEVRQLQSLHGDTEALFRYEPDLLVTALDDAPAERVGALRLLKNLWPQLAVLLVTDVAGEVAATPLAERVGATLLVHPDKPGQLAAAIEQALHGSDRPRAEVFLDLAHGMADEINNPLLFVSGHLQLLHSSLDPTSEKDRRDQVRAALDGIQRIQRTVDRLRQLSEASTGPRRTAPVDLGALAQAATAGLATRGEAVSVEVAQGDLVVRGDKDQLAQAIGGLARFADALAEAGVAVALRLAPDENAARLQLTIRGSVLLQWRLPRTFEPYYPSRMLRGHGHGLALFVAQTVVLGHKGQATAKRVGDSVMLEFVLPR